MSGDDPSGNGQGVTFLGNAFIGSKLVLLNNQLIIVLTDVKGKQIVAPQKLWISGESR